MSTVDQREQSVQTQINLVRAAAESQRQPLHQLPTPPSDFTGRESELHELLHHANTSNLAIFGLRGMGGIGKTALALELAHQLTSRYPDGQFYLDLRGTDAKPLTPADALAHILRAYTPPSAKLPDDQAQLESLYRSHLQSKRVLLLMDNAHDASQVSPLIPPPGSLLLITARQQFTLRGMHPLDLEKLPPSDAQKLLLTICPRIAQHAPTLAKLCGHLPLALRLAASSFSVRKGLSVDRYLNELYDTKSRLAALDRYRDQTDEKLGVSASLELSCCQFSGQLRQLWATLSVFPATFDTPAAATVWMTETPADAEEILGDLLQYSLIQLDEKTNRWSLHDLARDFAAHHLTLEQQQTAAQRHAAHYVTVLASANELFLKGNTHILTGLSLFDREWPNIEAGQRWAANYAGANDAAAHLAKAYPGTEAYTLHLRLHPRTLIQWLESALAAARHLRCRQLEGGHLGNLGLAYGNLGDARRAIEYHELSLSIAREIGNRCGEANSLGNLGLAHANLGEIRRAIEYYKQALAITREVSNRWGEANSLGNLGLAYTNLGETRRAIEHYEQQLAIVREIGDRRGEGADMGNLGIAYKNLGKIGRAIEYHELSLTIAREIGDRRGEGAELGNLGLTYANLRKTRRAIEYYEQALAIAREIGNRRGEGDTCWNMALAYYSLRQRAQAIHFAEQALIIYRQIEDPFAAKVERKLAGWRVIQSKSVAGA